jgi:hypothetical protein
LETKYRVFRGFPFLARSFFWQGQYETGDMALSSDLMLGLQASHYRINDELVSSPHLQPKTRFLLLSKSCGFVDVGCSLWREDRSLIYKCWWSSPAHSLIRVPWNSRPYFISQIRDFLLHCFLWLARLLWRYWNPPPSGERLDYYLHSPIDLIIVRNR